MPNNKPSCVFVIWFAISKNHLSSITPQSPIKYITCIEVYKTAQLKYKEIHTELLLFFLIFRPSKSEQCIILSELKAGKNDHSQCTSTTTTYKSMRILDLLLDQVKSKKIKARLVLISKIE
jgi:hypothetical protein